MATLLALAVGGLIIVLFDYKLQVSHDYAGGPLGSSLSLKPVWYDAWFVESG